MVDLIESEFLPDRNKGNNFIRKWLAEYGDDSIAELDSQQIGMEGISILAASKLTDQRIGVSFLEKSTRYVPFSPESFYTPAEIFEMGLVDDYKELCTQSYSAYNFIYNDLLSLLDEKYPLRNCSFYDTRRQTETNFENLKDEGDIKNAERAYRNALKAKAFDVAGYSLLTSTKTNLGFNANARSLEYMLQRMQNSPLSEINDLSTNMQDLLSQSIAPFLHRIVPHPPVPNPFGIYSKDNSTSITGLYKHNIVNLLKTYDRFHDDLDCNTAGEEGEEPVIATKPLHQVKPTKQNYNLVKGILSEMGMNTTSDRKHVKMNKNKHIDLDALRPTAELIDNDPEQLAIETLCSAILFENNENLLEYDEVNYNNIDDSLRIVPVHPDKIKSGIIYDVMNRTRMLDEFGASDNPINNTTENTLTYNDINAYWQENESILDKPVYQNFEDKNLFTVNKEQDFIIKKYIGNRNSRRERLGRAFELIRYRWQISSSFRIMREWKRHRMSSNLYPQVLTARNSYGSFIFPNLVLNNQHLLNEYKDFIEKSYKMYEKVIQKSRDYHAAQYCLPLATRCDYLTDFNFREMDHLFSLRTTPQAHEEIRNICQTMYSMLLIIHPNLVKLLKFVNLNTYDLGRISNEYRKEEKKNIN
jgi:thymidylate synthase ThyX